eukprot:11177015-Lingulodinium_polyedra.AAC.1
MCRASRPTVRGVSSTSSTCIISLNTDKFGAANYVTQVSLIGGDISIGFIAARASRDPHNEY